MITTNAAHMKSFKYLNKSAVLRAVEEEDQEMNHGYRRVAWPPPEERVLREFTPQPIGRYQGMPTSCNQTQYQKQQYQTFYEHSQHHEQHKQTAGVSVAQHYLCKNQLDNLQPHQQQLQQSSQDSLGSSPGVIILRKEAPVTQTPIAVYNSQPAAIGLKGGVNMRGDLKWPPPQYKEAAARENEERGKLFMGPACRPRRVQRDYTAFFAKNALSHHYPSYKVPPGTQHIMV